MTVVHPETEITSLEDLDEMLTPYEDNDDPSLRTHYINPPANLHIYQPGMTSKEIVSIARAGQIEIVALCGYRFVPKHNPDKYDLCDPCAKEAAKIDAGMNS